MLHLKKMVPGSHMKAHTQFSNHTSNDGVFGDLKLMTMTADGHENQIPTYQFWNQQGGTALALQMHETHDQQ